MRESEAREVLAELHEARRSALDQDSVRLDDDVSGLDTEQVAIITDFDHGHQTAEQDSKLFDWHPFKDLIGILEL